MNVIYQLLPTPTQKKKKKKKKKHHKITISNFYCVK